MKTSQTFGMALVNAKHLKEVEAIANHIAGSFGAENLRLVHYHPGTRQGGASGKVGLYRKVFWRKYGVDILSQTPAGNIYARYFGWPVTQNGVW